MVQTHNNAMPQRSAPTGAPLLDVQHLKKYFPVTQGFISKRIIGHVKAVDDVSFSVRKGETFGLVGESGSGKTTLGQCLLLLQRPTSGSVTFDGTELTTLKPNDVQALRQEMQVIFQDPYSSLNPRMTAGQIIGEPLAVHQLAKNKTEYRNRVMDLLQVVGLSPQMAIRYPHEFSGGQRQRIGIARALAVNPSLIVCDEPVSALDVSIQAQIITLLESLRSQFNLTYIFIAHDLAVVRHIADRVGVMYLGKMMEVGNANDVYANPLHPYTRALIDAAPVPDPVVEAAKAYTVLKGEIPSPVRPPSGCVFHTRCPMAIDACKTIVPELKEYAPGHQAACIRINE